MIKSLVVFWWNRLNHSKWLVLPHKLEPQAISGVTESCSHGLIVVHWWPSSFWSPKKKWFVWSTANFKGKMMENEWWIINFGWFSHCQTHPGLMHQFLGHELVLSVGDNLCGWSALLDGWFCKDMDDCACGSGLVSAFTALSVPFYQLARLAKRAIS